MATKKQKREAGLAKRTAYMAKVRESGLRALAADQQRRRDEEERILMERKKRQLDSVIGSFESLLAVLETLEAANKRE